jgi:hypothetical protein
MEQMRTDLIKANMDKCMKQRKRINAREEILKTENQRLSKENKRLRASMGARPLNNEEQAAEIQSLRAALSKSENLNTALAAFVPCMKVTEGTVVPGCSAAVATTRGVEVGKLSFPRPLAKTWPELLPFLPRQVAK